MWESNQARLPWSQRSCLTRSSQLVLSVKHSISQQIFPENHPPRSSLVLRSSPVTSAPHQWPPFSPTCARSFPSRRHVTRSPHKFSALSLVVTPHRYPRLRAFILLSPSRHALAAQALCALIGRNSPPLHQAAHAYPLFHRSRRISSQSSDWLPCFQRFNPRIGSEIQLCFQQWNKRRFSEHHKSVTSTYPNTNDSLEYNHIQDSSKLRRSISLLKIHEHFLVSFIV